MADSPILQNILGPAGASSLPASMQGIVSPANKASPVLAQALSLAPPPAADPETAALMANYQRNQAFMLPGDHVYNTPLSPQEEKEFRAYIADRSDPRDEGREFNPDAKITDYDMRGWWKAMKAGDPRAALRADENDPRMLLHRSDYWKTPYDMTFSSESQWAHPKKAPHWNDLDQLVTPDGKILYDDRASRGKGG